MVLVTKDYFVSLVTNYNVCTKTNSKKEKIVAVSFSHDDIAFTTLRVSRPLLVAIICRSRGRLSADEKEEKFASNDNVY